MERHETIVIGGGQAGLAMSDRLSERGREHILLEKEQLGGRWRSDRWDSLHFQFPNWSLRMPGKCYAGDDPEGFSHYSKVVEFLADYARELDPPCSLGTEVTRVRRGDGGFRVETSTGELEASNIVVATGAFPRPTVPAFADRISPSTMQIHSSAYRRPDQLADGAVLVVGSGSSGGQIAEELQQAGRRVILSVSRHRRIPRRMFAKDMLWWLYELGWIDRTIDSFPPERAPPAVLLSGIDGGHDLDVRKFAVDGMMLIGRATDADGDQLALADDLHATLADADAEYVRFRSAVVDRARDLGLSSEEDPIVSPEPPACGDRFALKSAGVASIVWCTGYEPAFEWIDIPVFDRRGAPVQSRGRTACQGLYFLGLHWMHTFKSGALFGVGDDAEHIAALIDGDRAGECQSRGPGRR